MTIDDPEEGGEMVRRDAHAARRRHLANLARVCTALALVLTQPYGLVFAIAAISVRAYLMLTESP